jgi:hypothetical protein
LLVRSLAAASVLILLPTLYFTFSRGGWIALGVGLVAAAALDSRRLQFLGTVLALTPAPALGIALASRSDALTRLDASLTAASREGHRLALVLAVLAVANALVVRRLDLVARRVSISAGMRRAIALALVAAVVVAAAAVLVRYGGPASATRRAYDAFAAPFPATGRDLNQRLFTFSGGERVSLWDAAWTDFEEHGLRGSGAGTYEFYWLRHREKAFKVRDAHSLYLESLAEIGPLGLAVLLATLAIPVAAAIRTRNHSLVPVAFGAYVAYLAHAGFDWDWEMSAITLAAMLTGAAPLVVARERAFAQPARRFRLAMTAGALVLAAFAFVGVIGNSAVAAAREAAETGRWIDSERHARKAMDWMPWSSEPWQLAGEAQLARRRPAPARKTLRTAISKDSQNWELWADLAIASNGRARRAAALRALRLNPLGPELAGLRRQFGSEE